MSVSLQDQYDKIYKYCYFKVKNKEIAEDLTQETFLKYFSQNSYINRGKPLAYLYTIAKHQCIDYFKKIQTFPLEETLIFDDNTDSILTNLALTQAIHTLPEDLAEILLLRFGNELGIGEIAAFFHISRFTVYRKINYALGILKTRLRKEDFYE